MDSLRSSLRKSKRVHNNKVSSSLWAGIDERRATMTQGFNEDEYCGGKREKHNAEEKNKNMLKIRTHYFVQ